MKKIQGLLSIAGLLVISATVSAGWGSVGGGSGSGGGYGSGGGFGSSGGTTSGYGSSGGYSAGYASSGGGYAAGGGSSGSYSAGYGSSGGASAGNSNGGTAHVGPFRRFFAHLHAHHANRALKASSGSSGGGSNGGYVSASYGSSGGGYSRLSYGSSGGYHSSGPYGSSGGGAYGGGSTGGQYSRASYGSTGGGYYGSSYSVPTEQGSVGSSNGSDAAPMYSSPSTYSAPTTDGPMIQPTTMRKETLDSSSWSSRLVASGKAVVDDDQIQLNVHLPESAIVYVNGNRTASKGSVRRFVSKDLEAGLSYRFEIRAEREVDGKTITDEKILVLSPGSAESIEFTLDEKPKVAETVLTLNVPNDAKVVLAGNKTKSVGETRTYRSHELAPGQVWEDYKITVTWNGQVKETTIRLIGGDELAVTFNFDDSEKVAMR